MLMMFPVGRGFIKLILIIADFHCMLLLAAKTHNLIIELA